MVSMYKNGSIFSGLLIGLAGWIFLSVGGGILGSILFSLGLMAVVYFGSYLYTGKAGSWEFSLVSFKHDTIGLLLVLLGNIIGCFLISIVARKSGTIDQDFLSGVIMSRENSDSLMVLCRSIGCGFLMELAVWIWREKKSILGVLFCVPAFILSGFYHSIADAFYYLAYWKFDTWMPLTYILTVIGNFLGCSIRRLSIHVNN